MHPRVMPPPPAPARHTPPRTPAPGARPAGSPGASSSRQQIPAGLLAALSVLLAQRHHDLTERVVLVGLVAPGPLMQVVEHPPEVLERPPQTLDLLLDGAGVPRVVSSEPQRRRGFVKCLCLLPVAHVVLVHAVLLSWLSRSATRGD